MSNETGFRLGMILLIVLVIIVSLMECTGTRSEYVEETVESTEV